MGITRTPPSHDSSSPIRRLLIMKSFSLSLPNTRFIH
ncbi:hypothetical protein F383_27729 [Gossypium arboreum]|uniref:Uncharacterized protein n=1 Tax=Gossypium arboreum TaxID=29729 RepID=A0A0B0MLS7_GOSAR|nr:hypothetical protein F383_27729 [Gossypium arboreum]